MTDRHELPVLSGWNDEDRRSEQAVRDQMRKSFLTPRSDQDKPSEAGSRSLRAFNTRPEPEDLTRPSPPVSTVEAA